MKKDINKDMNNEARINEMVGRLEKTHDLPDEQLEELLTDDHPSVSAALAEQARAVRESVYGKDVFIRGLIEFTSWCKNDCLYCGLRRSNSHAERYRLTPEEILSCCKRGYSLGFRTFVLQGGEDPFWKDDVLVPLVRSIKETYPDCALTLSLGERDEESYKKLYDAGADRYLLRHETADKEHYEKLHPADMSYDRRIRCLHILKKTGFQTGCGMMVGSPFQNVGHLIKDLRFIQSFQPQMVGIGPFIPQSDTPFGGRTAGSVDTTIRLLSIVRLMLPEVLLPATTALGTIDQDGRKKGLLAGANVIMPNLSPDDVRDKYLLYDNKPGSRDEAARLLEKLESSAEAAGYRICRSRGDHISVRR